MQENDEAKIGNYLLFPENRVIKKPIPGWLDKLQNRIDKFQINEKNYFAIAETYNQAALIFAQLGKYHEAKELCYIQIHYFIKLLKNTNINVTKFILQPWINLCRLDRISGNISDLHQKLKQLSKIKSLQKSIFSDLDFLNVYLVCKYLEPVKAYLNIQDYTGLLNFINQQDADKSMQTSILYEASLISLVNTGKLEIAMERLKKWSLEINSILLPIYIIRMYEINQIAKTKISPYLPIKLFEISIKRLNDEAVNLNAIQYAFHVAKVLYNNHYNHYAVEIIKTCLNASKMLNDDQFITDCLISLFKWEKYSKERSSIYKLMETHYKETHYDYSINKLNKIINIKSTKSSSKTNIESKLSFLFDTLQNIPIN